MFLYGLLSSAPKHLSITAQAEWKKQALGIQPQDEIHKLAMGFFLDQFEGVGHEIDEIENLSRFEWFAGSITAQRLVLELEGFLKSEWAQSVDITKEQLQIVMKLLKYAHEQSSLIDLTRSASLPLPLLAMTGSKICLEYADTFFFPDPDAIVKLAQRAHDKVSHLKTGEKALFLLGNLTHDTILTVERRNEELWEVCYYDTDGMRTLRVYEMDFTAPIFTQPFWQTIYQNKFSHEGTFPLLAFSNSYAKDAAISKQKKSTCHFRSLLAVIKDQILRHSGMESSLAIFEWKRFEILFGNYLIEGKTIQDPELLKWASLEQKNRSLLFKHAQEACEEFEVAYNDYVKIFEFFKETGYKVSSELAKFMQLMISHELLIYVLEKNLIRPVELKTHFNQLHPLVAYTLTVFEERFYKRETHFLGQLDKEIAQIASPFSFEIEGVKASFFSWMNWENDPEVVDPVPLKEGELNVVLERLKLFPEAINNPHRYPAIKAVLLQKF